MAKPVTAEYDAEEKTLRLAEPLEGVADHAQVQVVVTQESAPSDRRWANLSGILSKEAGEDLSRALAELRDDREDD